MFDIFIMDMGSHDANVQSLKDRLPHAVVMRYYNNHLDTIRRCVAKTKTQFVWVISSCCDYSSFDFDYRPAPWESYQLHCWPSGNQKFGDTFLINVEEFRKQQSIQLLEWYKDVNWHSAGVERLTWPTVYYDLDNLPEVVTASKFDSPYVWFKRGPNAGKHISEGVCLWTEKQRNLVSFSTGNQLILAPKDVKLYLKTQLYDYPYIDKQQQFDDVDLDIIYISNGEPDAEHWFDHLQSICNGRAKRVQNVNGRIQAYQEAAKLSKTDWFFAVFAKLEVLPEFDWSWQPDYLQEPKHYIFHSRNPVTGLEYGHMGIIAYNKKLVLDTHTSGLDFTLSKAHAVVPKISAVAHYNTTPELTWRTAFREVIKLKDDVEKTSSVESSYRLDTWLTQAEGNCAESSLQGARDALEYYELVKGDYTELMRSYEWAWLQDYYVKKYSV